MSEPRPGSHSSPGSTNPLPQVPFVGGATGRDDRHALWLTAPSICLVLCDENAVENDHDDEVGLMI